jgi:hypothetical protein
MAITANKVRLKQQALTGVISDLTQNGNASSFTLTVASDSVFAMLAGQSAISVVGQAPTEMKTTIANGGTVQVRGLLFFSAGKYTLVAERVTQP